MQYIQNYDPCNNVFLSTLLATLPVVTLFVMLVPMRLLAPWAAAGGAAVALVIAIGVFGMPADMAGLAFANGALFGLMPICWTIVNAMLLYNITVETGRFEAIKHSVAGLSPDHRLQAILIGFCFGAFLEGAAGGGTPVAICAAMMVGLGFDPFLAAGLCLIANTSPVAYGGFGTPLLTLESVTDIPVETLSHMAGNQLPFLSFIVPLWMVRCMCSWRDTFAVWPALVVSGGSFAVIQYFLAHSGAYPLTDIVGGLLSLVITGAFLVWWKPRETWRFETHRPTGGAAPALTANIVANPSRTPVRAAFSGWMPFIILCVMMSVIGIWNAPQPMPGRTVTDEDGTTHVVRTPPRRALDELKILNHGVEPPVALFKTMYELEMPRVHKMVKRTPPVVEKDSLESATWKFNWLTSPGTSVFFTVLLTLAYLRPSREQLRRIFKRTCYQMIIPVPTIVCMLGLGSVTRLGGLDAAMGMAFKETGVLYPFFAAMLGWLGVFLTGTDAASNALFGSLQKITALNLGLNPILITVANSTGGVMGKMIDAQSICVATAATERVGTEADIFKFVIWHSIALAAIVGLLVFAQAHWLSGMVPVWEGAPSK